MNNKELKPNIRFKEFSDNWIITKFIDNVEIERGGSPRPINNYITNEKDGLNWVKIGDAPKDGNYITETKEKIKKSGLSKTRQVFPEDLILSNSMSFGRPYIMQIEGCIHDGWLLIRNSKNKYNLIFLCYLLSTEYMYAQYKSNAAGSTVSNLNKMIVGDTVVIYPNNLDEQQQIGDLFETIDNILNNSKEKIEEWKNIRTSLLSKMFPKDGEKVPEIRFKGFSKEWRLCKIGEIVEFLNGHDLSWNDIDKKGKYECILYGNLYTDYGMIIYDEIKYKTNKELKSPVYSSRGDVLVPSSSTTLTGVAQATSIEKDGVLLGGGINILRPHDNVNGSYLSLLMNCYKNELLKLVKGITIGHIYNNDIKNIVLPIAQDIEEQKKIADLFIIIDKQIKKLQVKKEMFEKIKSTFLSKMFV